MDKVPEFVSGKLARGGNVMDVAYLKLCGQVGHKTRFYVLDRLPDWSWEVRRMLRSEVRRTLEGGQNG